VLHTITAELHPLRYDHKPTPEMTPSPPTADQFVDLVVNSLRSGSFRRLVLAKPRTKETCPRITVREIVVRKEVMLSVVSSFPTNDITKNVAIDDGIQLIRTHMTTSYLRAHLTTSTEQIDLSANKKGTVTIHRQGIANADVPVERGHDRVKKRFVAQDRPYLTEVGITDRGGHIIPAMARKWKQINKFVEILDGAIRSSALAEQPIVKVVDFGSGKGYLTFALHDHLSTSLGKQADVTGVELRADLVDHCNLAARRVSAESLGFVCGDIATSLNVTDFDVMVALHACDTATDLAIHQAIVAQASIVVCSPCCHKELRPQMKFPDGVSAVFRHGVHVGLEADMVTDTIRALLLEANGYDAKIFEFVGLEETSKNKMILAVKRGVSDADGQQRAAAHREVAAVKSFYGVKTHHLETLLNA
jgi:SAM-dependent methyltransferase